MSWSSSIRPLERLNRLNPLRSAGAGLRLWLQLGLSTGVAGVALVSIPAPAPAVRMPLVASLALGLSVGSVVYSAVSRRRPFLPGRVRRIRVVVVKYAFIGLLAANEEVIWRRVILGECLRAGAVAAIAGSTLAFAVAHRARPAVHLVTGAAFGGVYLASGALAASIAAHWIYNALLATLADRSRVRGRRRP